LSLEFIDSPRNAEHKLGQPNLSAASVERRSKINSARRTDLAAARSRILPMFHVRACGQKPAQRMPERTARCTRPKPSNIRSTRQRQLAVTFGCTRTLRVSGQKCRGWTMFQKF